MAPTYKVIKRIKTIPGDKNAKPPTPDTIKTKHVVWDDDAQEDASSEFDTEVEAINEMNKLVAQAAKPAPKQPSSGISNPFKPPSPFDPPGGSGKR